MKWLDWEKDPKKQSGSAEWGPIIKFWLITLSGASLIIWLVNLFSGDGK